MFLKTLIVIINLWRRRDGRTEKILKFDRHFPKVTSVNNRFPPHPSVLTIQILFSGEVRSILLAKPWLFFAQTQDAVKVFKVRLSGLQPIVSYVNSDIRNVLFRDLQINRVGVSVVHEKLFRGNVLRSQNGQRGISDVTVLNNIATYVQPRRGTRHRRSAWSSPKAHTPNIHSICNVWGELQWNPLEYWSDES